MRVKKLYYSIVKIMFFLLLTGIISGGSSPVFAQLTEKDVLASIAGKSIVPNLTSVAKAAEDLHLAARKLCIKQDDDSLGKAQDAWKKSYTTWCKAAPFIIGKNAKIEKTINKWPANGKVLDAAIQSKDLRSLLKEPDSRGFAGAEHLLFSSKGGSAFSKKGRCEHLLIVTGEISKLITEVKDDWIENKNSKFVMAGDGKPFLLPGDALSVVFVRVLNHLEILLRDRIIGPSNFFLNSSRVDNLEAWESNTSNEAIKATITGIREILVGDGKTGITRLVATKDGLYESKDPGLAKDIVNQLKAIKKTLSAFDNKEIDLYSRIKNKPKTLKKLYKQINSLQGQVKEAALILELDVRSGLESQLAG